jgi:osmotically-inducible protein OsmY
MTDDLMLQLRIMDELAFEPSVKAAHIGVSVRDGVVTLSGHVDSVREKYAAERTARRIKGVKAVAQELIVHLPSDQKTTDDEIAAHADKILNWDVAVPHDRISVLAEHGTVILRGEVDWYYQRAEAERDVLELAGVKAVINDILVSAPDGRVTLGGKVAARAEREAAERAAWSAPGVPQVEDQVQPTCP